jgi:predicted nucleic acid-binding protein
MAVPDPEPPGMDTLASVQIAGPDESVAIAAGKIYAKLSKDGRGIFADIP